MKMKHTVFLFLFPLMISLSIAVAAGDARFAYSGRR